MSEQPSRHLPAKLALVSGIAAAALHPESLAQDTEQALSAPQPAISLPQDGPVHPQPEQPVTSRLAHTAHPEAPTIQPTDIATKAHATVHVTKPAPSEHWTSRKVRPVIEPAHPITPPEKPPINPPSEKQPLHAENYTVPAEVSAIMKTETVYLPWSRCSGFLIRDDSGKPIGFDSAEHCGLLASSDTHVDKQDYHYSQRWLGSDGQYYVAIDQPVEIEVGNNLRDLQAVGTVDQIIAPAIDDLNHDMVLGVLAGSTPEQVLAAYNQNRLSAVDIAKLKVGDNLYSSAWPIEQPNNPGVEERQEFAQAFLGIVPDSFDTGQSINNMVVTAVPKDADGSICSPGASGSELFAAQKNDEGVDVARSVGTLTGYIDLSGKLFGTPQSANADREHYEALFGVDLSEMGSLCFYSTEAPTINSGNGSVINIASALDQIPGYEELYSPEAELQRAHDSFFDPAQPQQVIDGLVGVGGDKGGDYVWVDRPSLYYDPVAGSAVIEWYDPSAPDNLAQLYYDDSFYLTIYDNDAITGINLLSSTGLIEPSTGDPAVPNGFIDSTGLSFGTVTPDAPVDFQQAYHLVYDYDTKSLTITPLAPDGGKGGGK